MCSRDATDHVPSSRVIRAAPAIRPRMEGRTYHDDMTALVHLALAREVAYDLTAGGVVESYLSHVRDQGAAGVLGAGRRPAGLDSHPAGS
jgi:hypothetical protein